MFWQPRFLICSENDQSCKYQLRSVLRHLTITSKQRNFLFDTCMLWEQCQYLSWVVFLSGIASFNHSLLLVFICGYKAPSYVLCISWVGGKWMIIIRCLSSSKSLSLLSDQRLQKIPNQHHQHPILSFANATNVIFINLTGIYSTLTC